MYSGTGKAIFDWILFAKKDFHFSILMDVTNESNFTITRGFCLQNGIKLHVSRGLQLPGCIDAGIWEINNHLSANHYPVNAHQIVCFCDCREHRKRIDLLIAAFREAYFQDSRLRLVIGGKGSDLLEIPDDISDAVTGLGYIDQNDHIRMYQSSSLFVLLSDYEAFGLPIAEALCCGCPVLLNKTSILESVFANSLGVTFTNNQDSKKTSSLICRLVLANTSRSEITKEAKKLFCFDNL
jgi:glycosyltransferase involved in cell wall biosynthesis